jgi:hypothetical protein
MGDERYFDDVRELVQQVEEAAYQGIRRLASLPTAGVTEAELRERLESIRKCVEVRDGVRAIQSDLLAGRLETGAVGQVRESPDDDLLVGHSMPLDAMSAMHTLETIRYLTMQISGIDDSDDEDGE